MQNPARSYKYSCRKCPIRQRCIDDKSYGPNLKGEIERRFANRTDTFETWDLLQQDCLLVRHEREQAERTESSLLRRLRQARETPQDPFSESAPSASGIPGIPLTPLPAPPVLQRPPASVPEAPVSRTALAYGFQVSGSERLIRMPDEGDIVLGRFEHGFSTPPDIDLTLEDGEIPSVSRRHALVISRGGQHWIEDMGSSNGTYINGHPVPLGKTVQLSPGDRILLGRCRLTFTGFPGWMSAPDPRESHTASLLITHTGHRVRLPDRNQIMVGRPDPGLGFVPDVDVSVAGDIARYVSRRHVRILFRTGLHFLEELGSAAGTRLNGKPLLLGEPPALLRPGDHFWLGGCVLSYEWQLT